MKEFEFVAKKSDDEYAIMIKEFIDSSDSPLQKDIWEHFRGRIPFNRVQKITTMQKYVGIYWNIKRKVPKGYCYITVEGAL